MKQAQGITDATAQAQLGVTLHLPSTSADCYGHAQDSQCAEAEAAGAELPMRHYNASDLGIDDLVAKLRRKLRDPARLARMIKTARPVGYVFTGFSSSEAVVQVDAANVDPLRPGPQSCTGMALIS